MYIINQPSRDGLEDPNQQIHLVSMGSQYLNNYTDIDFLKENFYQGWCFETSYNLYLNGPRDQPNTHAFNTTNQNILFIRANVSEFRTYMYRYGRNNDAWNHTMENNQAIMPVSCHQYTASFLEEGDAERHLEAIHSPYGKAILDYFIEKDEDGYLNIDNVPYISNPMQTHSLVNEIGETEEIQREVINQDTSFIDVSIIRDIRARESQNARRPKFKGWLNSPFPVGKFNMFSMLGSLPQKDIIAQSIEEKLGPTTRIKTLKLENLYRGGDGTVSVAQVSQRANQLISGRSIFPIISEYTVLNQEDLTWQTVKILTLATFQSVDASLKYKRSRAFYADLLYQFSAGDGKKYFKPEQYQREMKERYGSHTVYWDGITKIIEDIQAEHEPVTMESRDDYNTLVAPKDFQYYSVLANLDTSQEVAGYQNISKAFDDINEKLNTSLREKTTYANDMQYWERELQRIKTQEEEYKSNILKTKISLEQSESIIEGYTSAIQSMSKEHREAKDIYKNYIDNFSCELDGAFESSQEWIQNLEKTGIIIEDILYLDNNTGTTLSIKSNPKLPFLCKTQTNNEYQLQEVSFFTKKPSIIKVDYNTDGENCRKIVGGPYKVKVKRSSLSIVLADTRGCFGMNNGSLWWHPHTPAQSMPESYQAWKNMINRSWVNACLGEASPGIYKAFELHDPKMAIFSAMTWINSANSSDQWGKNYKYFPKLADVQLDGDFSLKINESKNLVLDEETMDDINETIVEAFETIATEEPQEEQIQEPQEEVEEEAFFDEDCDCDQCENTREERGLPSLRQEIPPERNPNYTSYISTIGNRQNDTIAIVNNLSENQTAVHLREPVDSETISALIEAVRQAGTTEGNLTGTELDNMLETQSLPEVE